MPDMLLLFRLAYPSRVRGGGSGGGGGGGGASAAAKTSGLGHDGKLLGNSNSKEGDYASA